MNIGELIEKLSEYPKDMLVIVTGYETGYDDIGDVEELNVELSGVDEDDYLGKYDDLSHDEKTDLRAVVIPR